MQTQPGSRRALLIAGILLLISAWVPLLSVRFTSPQYPTESPTLRVYADRIAGDAHEFQVLSHYVGIQFPPDVPELRTGILVWVISGIGAIALGAALLGPDLHRPAAYLVLVSILCLAAWGQFRFYQSGHSLDPEAPMRMAVKPFTPPLFGWVKMRNIVIYHLPHYGSALILGAITALGITTRRRRAPAKADGGVTQEGVSLSHPRKRDSSPSAASSGVCSPARTLS